MMGRGADFPPAYAGGYGFSVFGGSGGSIRRLTPAAALAPADYPPAYAGGYNKPEGARGG
jgi:hypothetical protein